MTILTLSNKNYSSWSLRGWLLCQLAGLKVTEQRVAADDPDYRAELLLLSPSTLVPRLTHDGASVWDTLAIAEYLHETFPDAGMYPQDRLARAHCRSVAGEIHSGFANLRAALPMNLKARHRRFPVAACARPDIDRIVTIWTECLDHYGGPWLFGDHPTVADAMCAPVAQRFLTYAVRVPPAAAAYIDTVNGWAPMRQWIADARAEPDDVAELEMEF